MGKPTFEMNDFFHSGLMENETVMILDAGERKPLLFRADKILSVTSYDGSIKYEEGKDYILDDGMIVAPEGTKIPLLTKEKFFNHTAKELIEIHDGKEYAVYWGEGTIVTDYQVNVTYEHSDKWDGFYPECQRERFEKVLGKMERGEDVTFLFYGDSITYGASASFAYNYAPYQYSYALLVANELAKKYGYEVKYLAGKVPEENDVYGERGTLYYINPSVGGWTSNNGVENFEAKCSELLSKYGCDLAVVALGMNDQFGATNHHSVGNLKIITEKILALSPDATLLYVAPMMPNPDAKGWFCGQDLQQDQIVEMGDELRKGGLKCAVLRMTNLSKDILKHKMFRDYTGNNINHPNDFYSRVYAQAVFQTIYGYCD